MFKVISSVRFTGRTCAIEAFAEITTNKKLGKNTEGIEIFSPVNGFNLFGTNEEDKDDSEEAFFILERQPTVEC